MNPYFLEEISSLVISECTQFNLQSNLLKHYKFSIFIITASPPAEAEHMYNKRQIATWSAQLIMTYVLAPFPITSVLVIFLVVVNKHQARAV